MNCDLALATFGNSCREASRIVLSILVVAALATSNLSADPALDRLHYSDTNADTGDTGNEDAGAPDATPLNALMRSIVSIDVEAIENARTGDTYGTSRRGTGIVIDTSGLIVTAGDIVAEAERILITFNDGEVSPAELVAYDRRTGLGLVRAETIVPTVAIDLGVSAEVNVNDLGMIIPASGVQDVKAVRIGKIDTYSGGWEYIIESALHTYPPSTNFSGAALVSDTARLLGIGTLVSIDIDIDPKIRVPGNVFIPVDSLTEVLGKLLIDGRSDSPDRQPWIGLDIKQTKQGIAVSAVTPDSPAQLAGVRSGDIVFALNKKKIDGVNEFFKKLWKFHKPGDLVELMVLRGSEFQTLLLTAADYHDWLRIPAGKTQLSELAD